jgi:hypothetical protein
LKSKKVAREKVQVKVPTAKRWKKIMALFDEGSAHEHINPGLLRELGAKVGQPGGSATLHVKVLGEEYSWPFYVSDLDWEELGVDAIFGREFMKIQGVILKPAPKRMTIEYAPGYPQGPVI